MNKRSLQILLILFLSVGLSPVRSQNSPQNCTITYVANEGFLIESAKHKVLVDALFGPIKGNWCDQPGDSVLNLMWGGTRPYDKIDLVLVTHNHPDHFRALAVIKFLKRNPGSALVCPEQANEMLKKEPDYSTVASQIRSLKPDTLLDSTMNIHEISIRVIRMKHGSWFEKDSVTGKTYDVHKDVENLGYLVGADGFTFLHTGDCSTADKEPFIRIDNLVKETNVAFLGIMFLRPEGQSLISEHIHAKNIILMHVQPSTSEYFRSVVKSVPEMFVFIKPGDKTVIGKTN